MKSRVPALPFLAAFALLCVSCGPPPATKEVTYGVWLGTEIGAKGRVMVTFIAPDKAEVEFVDDKDKKKIEGKWEVKEGAVLLTRDGKTDTLKFSYIDQNDEKKEKLATGDGTLELVKV